MRNGKRLVKGHDAMVAGVLSGIADYVDVDPTIVRILFVILVLITGFLPGVLIYGVLWISMPDAHA